jgi:molybdenum cofactor biosynthesis protein B
VHQLDYRHRPCNFVEIMPRLTEAAGVRARK